MTFGSLFAGVGGFDLGFERAGLKGRWNVEKEATCRKLLAAKFPEAAQFDDVHKVGAHNLEAVDVIAGGFPCQDLSLSGKRVGLSGARSGLFYQLTRITNELRPAFLVWENFPGLLSSEDGRDFARVLMELDRIGYHGAWRTFNAQYFGVAQRRRRVFGLFTRLDIGARGCGEILSLTESLCRNPSTLREEGEEIAGTLTRSAFDGSPSGGDGRNSFIVGDTIARALTAERGHRNNGTEQNLIVAPTLTGGGRSRSGYSLDNLPLAFSSKDSGADSGDVAPTLRAMGHKNSHSNGGGQIAIAYRTNGKNGAMEQGDKAACLNTATDPNQTIIVKTGGVRRITPRECERLQGFPDDWSGGFSDSVRYHMMGNAVAVPCSFWIGRHLLSASRL